MSLRLVPTTPRVISPSPTPSERSQRGQSQDPEEASYLGPVTRAAARRRAPPEDRRERKPRARSRSPDSQRMTTVQEDDAGSAVSATASTAMTASDAAAASSLLTPPPSSSSSNNSLLVPPTTPGYWTWRDFSRSPSPLGLIPIHRHWRSFVHKHEVPRKALHVSIGFLALWLYTTGTSPAAVTPWLMGALIPIATADVLRFNWPAFNRLYVSMLGALMRETEFSGFNGVIFYLIGAWTVLAYLPKDVGMTSILLLSWCDTAASTFGRLYGRYTPRIRRGKSLAGSLAAFVVGVATASLFWGSVVPSTAARLPESLDDVMFRGVLRLPEAVATALGGVAPSTAEISGGLALAVVSVWSGFVASASEVVDLFGLDDNLTIPVLSGLGIWGFLRVFGQ
jgi:diacylglycerol kinase (CTP)